MIQHSLGTELWFAEHLSWAVITPWWTERADTATSIFKLGASGHHRAAARDRATGRS